MSGPLPGAVHDLTAARIWGIIAELAACGLVPLGDKGYLGEDCIRAPYRGRNKPASQKDANRTHARVRAPGERANAPLKSWRILRKLRCCPGTPGSWPQLSTSFRPAKSEDEKHLGSCSERLPLAVSRVLADGLFAPSPSPSHN